MTRNKLAAHKTIAEKQRAYDADILNSQKKIMAYCSNGTTVPLVDVDVSHVEFIGGLWRVQDKFLCKIQMVRDVPFVLGERVPRNERNLFEFYRARCVCENCYGKFLAPGPEKIVAKYTTDNGTYWSYGDTVEQARAFLGIKLYDEYMELIHSVVCKNQPKENQK